APTAIDALTESNLSVLVEIRKAYACPTHVIPPIPRKPLTGKQFNPITYHAAAPRWRGLPLQRRGVRGWRDLRRSPRDDPAPVPRPRRRLRLRPHRRARRLARPARPRGIPVPRRPHRGRRRDAARPPARPRPGVLDRRPELHRGGLRGRDPRLL